MFVAVFSSLAVTVPLSRVNGIESRAVENEKGPPGVAANSPSVRQVVRLNGNLVPVDDLVGLDLDGDDAGRAGEDTEGEQDEEEALHTITYRWRSI